MSIHPAHFIDPTNHDGFFPPLPEPLSPFPELPFLQKSPLPETITEPVAWLQREQSLYQIRSLRCGCYLVNYKPTGSALADYDGTLRVECHSNGRTASGDLYRRPIIWVAAPGLPPGTRIPLPLPGPKPEAGIPVLALNRYVYYLRVTQILEYLTLGNSFTLGFQMWRFIMDGDSWSSGGTWIKEDSFTALMTWQAAPAGYPSSGDYLTGDVKNSAGTVTGRLSMGWVSPYLRKATIEVDRVTQSEAPIDNGAGVDWRTVGDGLGWDLGVDESDSNVMEPSGESWTYAECHAAMLARRDASNLDVEWRYHVLALRLLDGTERGVMYDAGASDSNNVPREGCAIASHWIVPNDEMWGQVQGMRFGAATLPYFRTAVHETGHAMGLSHNPVDNGFMNASNVIAANSLSPGSPDFPDNIQWAYNPADAKRLRHMPDIHVRPGGAPIVSDYATTPISPTDLSVEVEGLELHVTPLLEAIPLGAPVRINIELTNTRDEPIFAPTTLSMKSGLVKGRVIDPAGTVRTFSSLLLCIEEYPLGVLRPKTKLQHAITLLRGVRGALFPMPGVYRIIVEVRWESAGVEAAVAGDTNVMVTATSDDAHARAALKTLSTPDALLTLVLGGDHLAAGIEAIQTALGNPLLRPHFAFIEAKRLAERFGKRKANLRAAAELIDDAAVMSPAEIKRAAELVKAGGAESVPGRKIARVLKTKIIRLKVSGEIKDLIDSL